MKKELIEKAFCRLCAKYKEEVFTPQIFGPFEVTCCTSCHTVLHNLNLLLTAMTSRARAAMAEAELDRRAEEPGTGPVEDRASSTPEILDESN